MNLGQALRMNEPQFNAMIFLSGMNIVACSAYTPSCPLWVWLIAVLFWPSVAIAINLIDPPTDESEQSIEDAADVLEMPAEGGWQCRLCQYATRDLEEMRQNIWPGGDLVCPQCGSIGEFIDYKE